MFIRQFKQSTIMELGSSRLRTANLLAMVSKYVSTFRHCFEEGKNYKEGDK